MTGDGKNANQDFISDTLIDSEAQEKFLDKKLALKKGIALTKLKTPITPINMDRTENKSEKIKYVTWLNLYFRNVKIIIQLLVTDLEKEQIILGLLWLQEYNSTIDWTKGTINIFSIKSTQSFNKMILWLLEITRAEIILLAPNKPSWKEVYEELDFSSTLTPLISKEPVLLNIEEEKEAAINWKEAFEEEKWVWINMKTNSTHELAHKAGIPEKPSKEVPEAFLEFKEVFEKKPSEQMPERKKWDHLIDFKFNFMSKDSHVYPMNPEEQQKLREFLDENLWKGYIRPLTSFQASPCFFVFKKDSKKLWPCQDYRSFNTETFKNTHPLSWISDLFDKLKRAKYFTKLDLYWRYNNVWIKEGDKRKVAKTCFSLFKPLVMFFSLCNSPSTFQNMMDKIFILETHEGWIIIYMDDIFIFSKDRKELEINTQQVLQKLKDNDFFLNLDKCVFDVKEVEYLGMVIQENQIKMERTKLEEIINWSTPMTVKQVWSFLGFGNFYRKFIGHYVNIAQSNKWPNKEGSSLELDW